jgi:hypothetical protein
MATASPTEPKSTRTVLPAFQAWRRRGRGSRWTIIANGSTDAEAFRNALNATEAEGPGHGDLLVLPTGQEP